MDNQTTVMIADNTEEFCSSLVTTLQRSEGFRVVGTRERIARRDGRWRDVVLLERRSPHID